MGVLSDDLHSDLCTDDSDIITADSTPQPLTGFYIYSGFFLPHQSIWIIFTFWNPVQENACSFKDHNPYLKTIDVTIEYYQDMVLFLFTAWTHIWPLTLNVHLSDDVLAT